MAKLRSITLLAALGLAGVTYAEQNPTPQADTQAEPPTVTDPQSTQNPDPAAASSPHQRDVTKQPGTESTPNESPDPEAASSPHQKGTVGETPHAGMAGTATKLVGLQVVSPSGEPLGSVIDVTMDASRQPEYAVISTGNDTSTAVPYSAVAAMIKDNKIVMDRTRLQNSPQVAQSELKDKSNSKWRADADKYWSAGAIRSASPGTGVKPEEPRDR
jgi:sporulation protein YlmC with PRC-barrel domain